MFLNLSSVKAYAVDYFYNMESFSSPIMLYVDGSSIGDYKNPASGLSVYHFSNGAKSVTENIHFVFKSSWDIARDMDHFDYYFYSIIDCPNSMTFTIDAFEISYFEANAGDRIYYTLDNPVISAYNGRFDGDKYTGYTVLVKLPEDYRQAIASVRLLGSGSISANLDFSLFLVQVEKGSDTAALNSIIDAINQQTDDINNKIDEVLTPEGENNLGDAVDQITDQVHENLGALGFAHDTVENFIGLFNEEPPAPIINVPPLKMKIKGVEHQFFNGYQYDFRSMEDNGLSVLVGAVRTAGTLVLWWAFLQYCLKEFERFFRR